MRRNFAGRLMFLEQHPLLGGWKLVDSIVYLWDTQRVAVLMSVVDEGGGFFWDDCGSVGGLEYMSLVLYR